MSKDTNAAGGRERPQPGGASPSVETELPRLLELGKCKQAVELAKEHHKRVNTPASRRMLVEAYVARINQFQSKGMAQEAQTLLDLVQQRFPEERHQLGGMEIRSAAANGRIDELLRPLASDQTTAETRASIERALAAHITDLSAVAACEALPAAHPLRSGAAAVWKAFVAVTSGPVTEEAIALPEISRRSPWAAWKMLIRAIAAFYRHDDEGCRRALDAIPADAAVTRAAIVVRGLVDGKKPATGVAAAIFNRVHSDDQSLRAALDKIERSFESFDTSALFSGIRESVRLCAASRPELLDRLRQHISVRCAMHEVPVAPVSAAMGTSLKNAYFWRLLARMSESRVPEVFTAMYWERFLRHAVNEGMFSDSSAEAAAVWMRIGELLSTLSLRKLERDRTRIGQINLLGSYYDEQPPEIARLRPKSDKALADQVLQPGEGYRQAARIQPQAETFTRWWAWAQGVDLPAKHQEDIALEWQRGRPGDVQPLIHLSSLAESRGAFSLAIKRLGQAEAIDPLNQKVRQARVRLTLAIAWRHFADGKAHLVEKDLADLAALPSMGEGDRAAVLECMRGAWHAMRNDAAAEQSSLDSVVRQMGPLVGPIVFHSIKAMGKHPSLADAATMLAEREDPPIEIAQAQARLCRLAEDLQLKLWRPAQWDKIVAKVLRERPCPLSSAELFSLGRGAIGQSDAELAYLASAAGLARSDSPAATARFLLLRAKSLTEFWHRPRATQCLRAALELARQAHDEDLIRDIFATVDRDPFTQRIIANARSGQNMGAEVLQAVLTNEKKAESFPKNPREQSRFVVEEASTDEGSLFGQRGFGDQFADWADDGDEEDDFYDGYDDDDDEDAGFDEEGFEPGPAGLFDVGEPPELSKKEAARLKALLQRRGIESPEDMLADATPLIEAMAKAMGFNASPAEIKAMADQLRSLAGGGDPGLGSGFPFPPPGKRKKRK